MKLLFASDSFKGSLTSEQTIELLTKAANEVFDDPETIGVPVADGGEGTVDAIVKAEKGEIVTCSVHGPLMEKIDAGYGVINGDQAVIEMSAASGLPLVLEDKRNPMNTTSFGSGELILHALDKGYRKLYIAIGGSATNDGGMGCARALGARFLDRNGNELVGSGRDLINVHSIDMTAFDPRIKECSITVMCDVKNPLCGKDGATYTFGAQKGATPVIQAELEEGMCNYRDVIKKDFGIDCDSIEGGGAAGGLGAALRVFFDGKMRSGIEVVLDLIGFDERLEGVDLVVTGEGKDRLAELFWKGHAGCWSEGKSKGYSGAGAFGFTWQKCA